MFILVAYRAFCEVGGGKPLHIAALMALGTLH